MGIVTKLFGWVFHPINDEQTSVPEWLAGLALVLIVSFLWTTVLREIE